MTARRVVSTEQHISNFKVRLPSQQDSLPCTCLLLLRGASPLTSLQLPMKLTFSQIGKYQYPLLSKCINSLFITCLADMGYFEMLHHCVVTSCPLSIVSYLYDCGLVELSCSPLLKATHHMSATFTKRKKHAIKLQHRSSSMYMQNSCNSIIFLEKLMKLGCCS